MVLIQTATDVPLAELALAEPSLSPESALTWRSEPARDSRVRCSSASRPGRPRAARRGLRGRPGRGDSVPSGEESAAHGGSPWVRGGLPVDDGEPGVGRGSWYLTVV